MYQYICGDFSRLSRPIRGGVETNATVPHPKFVLYVGALDWRKNVITVVDAFAKLPDDLRRDLKFVLAGDHPPPFSPTLRRAGRNCALPPDNFIALGHVSDRDLVRLYKVASLLIQPSLMEGFGLTALEAMMCGAPVIGSDQGALPEVVGNPEVMFDPRDPQNIADRIVHIFRDPDFTAQVAARGLEQAQRFTWKKSAEIATKALIETACRRQRPKYRNPEP